MAKPVKIFISYSHEDKKYLAKNSLLSFLQGLEQSGVEFWTDKQIKAGESWDDVIKTQIRQADIALVLVSQWFLNSDYCQNTEIREFLAHKKYLFPIILSPCEWQRHDWLKSRQFLPGGDKTIETHFKSKGARTTLFREVLAQLREIVETVRKRGDSISQPDAPAPAPASAPPPALNSTPANVKYSGKSKLVFCRNLGNSWSELATLLEIPSADQARFSHGEEPRGIWDWLENRRKLGELEQALRDIGRNDLAGDLEQQNPG
jgi:hypothetical protein